MCEVCEVGLAIQGRDVRNVRFLHGGVGGRGGKEWRRKTRLSKTRHGRGAKLWRFEGGGSGSDAPAHTDPQYVPCLPFRPVNHCPFINDNAPAGDRCGFRGGCFDLSLITRDRTGL